ncbi:MAG: ABC transporter permease [SAR324 cluster bacterium]|nr:ABC transporter permease [SAR324 cluster bacterium]
MNDRSRSLKLFAITYLGFLYAPVLLLPVFAFNDSTIIAFPLKSFTWGWFTGLAKETSLQGSLQNSLLVAISTAILSTCLGVLASRASARYEFFGKKAMVSFLMLPLVLPEIIIGVSLLVVLMQLGLPLSLWTVILGHTLLCMPFSIAILSSAFANMDQSLEEASLDLGETRWGTFRRVILPLVTPGLLSSFLIAFTLSLDEFIIAFFLTGTQATLPVYIWGQLRFPAKLPGVMALGFLLLLLSLVLLSLGEYFRRRMNRLTGGQVQLGGLPEP